ncbi:MAG: lactonase family protein [Flavobacteriaceae bacterium]|nr:lactonase family protein [Flavobacteriaceae bacterium]
MKQYIPIVFILLLAVSCNKQTSKISNGTPFYVGTYTDGDSKGIYQYALQENGMLDSIGLAAEADNPSFLTKSKDGNYLLAVSEISDKHKMGAVESYKIDGNSLKLLSKHSSGGAHPCYITVNDKGYVLTANYTGGNIGMHQLNNRGELSELLFVQQHSGRDSTDRQEGPHAHSVWFDGTKGNVISVDLGTNELWFSKLDTLENKLVLADSAKLKMNSGAGPRHLTFHPNGEWIYVVNELNSTVRQLIKTNEGLYVKGTVTSTLPADFNGESYCADIHISHDGKFVYASNRGHDSLAIYSVDPDTGTLSLVGFESVKGKTPRNFTLTPNNEYLLVANQNSNNIVSFKRDSVTGKLTFVDEIKAPKPVCILF